MYTVSNEAIYAGHLAQANNSTYDSYKECI